MSMIGLITKVVNPIKRRVYNMIAKGIVKNIYDDKNIQELQLEILKSEIKDNIQRFQEYGFSSCPHPESESITVFLTGNRDNGIVIATEDKRYRIKNMNKGEVCIYTDEGDKIHFKRNRLIEITTNELDIDVNGITMNIKDKISVNGDFEVTGNIKASGEVEDVNGTMNEMRGTYNGHNHPFTGLKEGATGTTSTPSDQMD